MKAALTERSHVIPGGCLTRSKALFGRWAEYVSGAVIKDTDGREYIDMLCGLGAISLGGYRVKPPSMGVYSLPSWREVAAAECVLEHVAPWASWARFVKTGSESTLAAMMISKAATGREGVLLSDYGFHGWHEWCSRKEHGRTFTHGQDLAATWDEADGIAAVFIEPHRWEPVNVEWLRSVRAFCDRIGALLVFDSMIYGGRWHLGGTSAYFGVVPDLECFGKALGNGQAVAFVVGAERTKPYGDIPSGTYSGDVVGLSAVLDTVQAYLTTPVIETMWARGRQLAAGLDALVASHPHLLKSRDGAPVHQRLTFHDPANGETFARLMWDRGVLWHPGATNVCFAHTDEQIETVIGAARASLETMT